MSGLLCFILCLYLSYTEAFLFILLKNNIFKWIAYPPSNIMHSVFVQTEHTVLGSQKPRSSSVFTFGNSNNSGNLVITAFLYPVKQSW